MRRIINGVEYDTETAERLGSAGHGLQGEDLDWTEETLYRRRKDGRFFMYGEGGPNSDYARWLNDNDRKGGRRIDPYTREEASRWAEDNLKPEEWEHAFGPADKDDVPPDRSPVWIEPGARRALEREAGRTGQSVDDLGQSLIADGLRAKGGTND